VSRRGRRLTAALTGLVVLLFAGRWTAGILADRWWAAQVAPAAVGFLTNWHLLRVVLDLAGVLIASAWFIGHLLAVYRAVGSVQVRRNVANLEFREALTPGALLAVAVGTGAALGVLVGAGASQWANDVSLAWQGAIYGMTDPLMQRDIGLYVAQLPMWRAAHSFAFMLLTLALGVVFALYLVVGAVRWIEGRPAINNHARVHLGWLLAGLALTLMWGYLLERYELVAGLGGVPDEALWRATRNVAPILAGVALATAVLSVAWAVRARHALAAAGWIVLAGASLVGHWMVPPAIAGDGEPVADPGTVDRLTRFAYGLELLREVTVTPRGEPVPPRVPAYWNPPMVARMLTADSVDILSIDPAMLSVQGRPRPVWLAARTLPGGRMSVSAVADDRVGPAGEPLFYEAHDSVPRPLPAPLLELGEEAFGPAAPPYRVNDGQGTGVPATSWPRRILLAWALQAGRLLGPLPPGARVDWPLSPVARLERLAPYATWTAPVARVIDGELVWLVDGYTSSGTFPLSPRVTWRGRQVGSVRAGFLGTVSALNGATHVFLRPGSDPLAEAWAGISEGVVEPASSIPGPVLRAAPYPLEQFRIQARELERPGWDLGVGSGRVAADSNEPPRADVAWSADGPGPRFAISFERTSERRVTGILLAGREQDGDGVRLVRIDSAVALPSRGMLETRWSRFPTYAALNDSIRDEGGHLDHGPIRFDLTPSGVVGYQMSFARRANGGTAVVWVSVAAPGDRLGAGHTLAEAWSNLLGASVPAIAGAPPVTRLDDARRLLLRADSALRGADWAAFGRAWDALRKTLGLPPDSAGR
jgi:hypothetical protein